MKLLTVFYLRHQNHKTPDSSLVRLEMNQIPFTKMKITFEQLFNSFSFPFSFVNYINIIMETFVCNAELYSIKGLLPKRKTKNLMLLNVEENRIILSSSHDLRANLLYFDMCFNKHKKL